MNTEEKLVSLSEKYIFNETVASLLLLLNSALEQKSEGRNFEENYNVSEDLKEIRRKIKNYILSMDTVLLDGEVRKNALEECIKMKKQLVSIYKIIYRYFAKLNVVATMVSDEVAVRKYKEDNNVKDKKIELSLFYRDCVEFLQSSESENELMHHIGELFECVPLKMTREKYFAIMEKSLSEAFKDASKGEIEFSLEFFANTCAPEFSEGYGKYFPEIADFLKERSALKLSELSDEELSEEFSNKDFSKELSDEMLSNKNFSKTDEKRDLSAKKSVSLDSIELDLTRSRHNSLKSKKANKDSQQAVRKED